ncbi:MAG: hypothetical protein ACE5J3_12975, partial [Methanosarcinales archaeon]
ASIALTADNHAFSAESLIMNLSPHKSPRSNSCTAFLWIFLASNIVIRRSNALYYIYILIVFFVYKFY